jgi:hypothetical protein
VVLKPDPPLHRALLVELHGQGPAASPYFCRNW